MLRTRVATGALSGVRHNSGLSNFMNRECEPGFYSEDRAKVEGHNMISVVN